MDERLSQHGFKYLQELFLEPKSLNYVYFKKKLPTRDNQAIKIHYICRCI